MNMATHEMDEMSSVEMKNPGEILAALREKKGMSREYAAGKLHLRVRIIELIDADEYHSMPATVFTQGYIRAYAKLLGEAPESYVEAYKTHHTHEHDRKSDKVTLWQGKRESNRVEKAIRWVTAGVATAVVVALGVFWYMGQGKTASPVTKEAKAPSKTTSDLNLTEISKMQSLFRSTVELPNLEK